MAPLPMQGGPPPGSPGPAASPMGPPGGVGAASVPGRMAGSQAQGSNLLRGAVEMLGKALGALPLGSEEHQAATKAYAELSKHVGPVAGAGDPQAVIQQLAQLARAKQQASVPSALSGGGGAGGPGGGGGPPPGAPPPMAA